jgi:hypothetical protein
MLIDKNFMAWQALIKGFPTKFELLEQQWS